MADESKGAGGASPTHDGDETKAGGPLRVTETPNTMTMEVDVVGPHGAVRCLRQADAQMFAGWKSYPGFNDAEFMECVDRAVAAAVRVLSTEGGTIVLTGCGTSGRMGFWCARSFNAVLKRLGKPPAFQYLVSGGDTALLLSDELPEDDPHLGIRELKAVTDSAPRSMLVGITCGISAAYVLGQVEHGMATDSMATVLMGFNPPDLARNMPVDGWDKTCRDVALALQRASDADNILLTPVVGPEPITGSTRMKGGTATKILLELVFGLALRRLYGEPVFPLEPLRADGSDGPAKAAVPAGDADAKFDDECTRFYEVATVLQAYEITMRRTYLSQRGTGDLAAMAGEALRVGGHLYYVGGRIGGVLGLVDASEMPDTYGSPFDEVRGFTTNGWLSVENAGGDLRDNGKYFHISHADFSEEIVPTLTAADVVIFVGVESEDVSAFPALADAVSAKSARLGLVWVAQGNSAQVGTFSGGASCAGIPDQIRDLKARADACSMVWLPFLSIMEGVPAFAEIAAKWTLNCISTAAQIAKGCVYTNRMINVGVLNNKLYFRAINLVRQFAGATFDTARDCLLKVIHDVDELTDEIRGFTITKHIQVATPKNLVVPITMLLATGRFTRESAAAALAKEPVLRNIVSGLVLGDEA